MAKVIFSVGEKHPLYNKVVDATILGKVGYGIEAETIDVVHYPYNPKGILICRGKKCIGYKARAAYDEKYIGFIEKIVEE